MTQISDHAIVRFLERVKGIDMDVIRSEMLTPAVERAQTFGAPVVIGKNGERLLIKNGVIITVYAKGRYQGKNIR